MESDVFSLHAETVWKLERRDGWIVASLCGKYLKMIFLLALWKHDVLGSIAKTAWTFVNVIVHLEM